MILSEILSTFSGEAFRELMPIIQDRCQSFGWSGPGVLLRHDVDDDIDKACRMADIEAEYGVQATFFILNTAGYWRSADLMQKLLYMQKQGHEIGWHNNVLTEWIGGTTLLKSLVEAPLGRLRDAGIEIRGSASHGDRQCRRFGYLNYDVFTECERVAEGIGFPNFLGHPRVSMKDFGLEYEAYHVPYDLYVSESGGKHWNRSFADEDLKKGRVQMLIHPQWWKI